MGEEGVDLGTNITMKNKIQKHSGKLKLVGKEPSQWFCFYPFFDLKWFHFTYFSKFTMQYYTNKLILYSMQGYLSQ